MSARGKPKGASADSTNVTVEVPAHAAEIMPNLGSLVLVGASGSATVGRRDLGPSFDLDGESLLRALPELGAALQARGLVQIVGPPDLLDGIRRGIYKFTTSDSGFTTVVRGPDGKIVGHVKLQFADGFARGAAALAGWQIASAITLQHYLHRIDRHLVQIALEVRALRTDAAWAVFERARDEVPRFVAQLQTAGRLEESWRQRLDVEERAVDLAVRQELRPVVETAIELKRLRHELDDLMTARDRHGALQKTARSVVASLPGGLRSQILDVIANSRAALASWERACYGRQIYAALAALQLADDALRGNVASDAGELQRAALAEAAAGQLRLTDELGALRTLDRATLDRLYVLDGSVRRALDQFADEESPLEVVAREAAERLDMAATTRVSSFVLERRRGGAITAREVRTAS